MNVKEKSFSYRLIASGIVRAESKGRTEWCWTEQFQCDIQSTKKGWFKLRNHLQTGVDTEKARHLTNHRRLDFFYLARVMVSLVLIPRQKARVTAPLSEGAHKPSALLSTM